MSLQLDMHFDLKPRPRRTIALLSILATLSKYTSALIFFLSQH